jgi:hypothetical protein
LPNWVVPAAKFFTLTVRLPFLRVAWPLSCPLVIRSLAGTWPSASLAEILTDVAGRVAAEGHRARAEAELGQLARLDRPAALADLFPGVLGEGLDQPLPVGEADQDEVGELFGEEDEALVVEDPVFEQLALGGEQLEGLLRDDVLLLRVPQAEGELGLLAPADREGPGPLDEHGPVRLRAAAGALVVVGNGLAAVGPGHGTRLATYGRASTRGGRRRLP